MMNQGRFGAYWISRMDVLDAETYRAYIAAAGPAFERYGAVFLARGGRTEVLEGTARSRNIVIAFASMDDALACYNCEQYAKARALRQKAAAGEIILVEGV
jgi:uncharacterized protein (DUF1330 family)